MKKQGCNDVIAIIYTLLDVCFLILILSAEPSIFTDYHNHIREYGIIEILYGLCVVIPNIIILIQNASDLAPYFSKFSENRNMTHNKSIVSYKGSINDIDNMSGEAFEKYCASLLQSSGYKNVSLTPTSGDQGVDILAEKDGVRYAIQCKCYSSPVGNSPVQEVHAGKEIYDCHVGVVMTNQYFTPGAKQAAQKTRTLLWDRDTLRKMIQEANVKTS